MRNSTIGDFSNNNRPLKPLNRPNIPLNRPHKSLNRPHKSANRPYIPANRPHKSLNRPHIPSNRPLKLLNRPHIPKNENALFAKEVKTSANRAVLGLLSPRAEPSTLKSNFNTLYQNCSPRMALHATFDTIFVAVDERQQKHPSFSF